MPSHLYAHTHIKEIKTLANALASGHVPPAVPSFMGQWESADAPAPDVTF